MKNKILTFIIGVLVGAIIATGGFLIYSKNNNRGRQFKDGDRPQMMQDGGRPGQRPDAQNSNNQDGNQSTNSQTPPELPSDSNANTTSQT